MTDKPRNDSATPDRGRAVKLLIALAVLNAALVPVFAFRGTTELDVYITAALRLVRGEEIYRLAGDIVPAFTYPPIFALIVTPITWLPELGEQIAWCVVQITLAAVLVAVLWCGLGPRLQSESGARHGAAVIFWTVMLLVGLRYLLSPLENQSHDLVVAVLVTGGAMLGARGRDGLGGLLLGLATALKATPLLFLPVLVLQRRWRAVGAMVAAILVASAAPDLIAPRNDGESNIVRWIEIASGAARPGSSGGAVVWGSWNHLNQNLAGTVYRLTAAPSEAFAGPDVSIVQLSNDGRRLLTIALQALVLLTVLGVTLRSNRLADPASDTYVQRRLGEAGVVACGMILLSPMSSKAHYCVLLIGVAVIAVEFGRRPRAVLGGLLALMFVSSTLTAKGLLGSDRGNLFLAFGSTMLSAVLLLAALATWLTRQRRPLAGTPHDQGL